MPNEFNPTKRNDGTAGCSNGDRARRACFALGHYKAHLLNEAGAISQEDVVDLLTDLLHYCDREHVQRPDGLIELAKAHHQAER